MKWRAINGLNHMVEGNSYQELKDILEIIGENTWLIEYFDSDNEWLELETIDFAPRTGEILVQRGSHKLHA